MRERHEHEHAAEDERRDAGTEAGERVQAAHQSYFGRCGAEIDR
jgi:hypothetical protein